MTERRRGVAVKYGAVGARPDRSGPPAACVIGITDFDFPRLAALFPRAVIRTTSERHVDGVVEHVRIQSREAAAMLPGLRYAQPSRIRDAVTLLLSSGARSVDLILARMEGAQPWDLDHPDLPAMLEPFLNGTIGSVMLYPDIGGPQSVGPGTGGDVEARVERFIRTVQNFKKGWKDRYQVALLDDPAASGALAQRVLHRTASSDASLVRWVGEQPELQRHGWRSAASVVAGILGARPDQTFMGVAGQSVPLRGGRKGTDGRFRELTLGHTLELDIPESQYYIDVQATPDGRAVVRSEPFLRAPVGAWTLPAARTTKLLHWLIWHTASKFVFESAHESRAFALASAVSGILRPFNQAGLLVGPGADSTPVIRGGVVRTPGQPGLRVEINAQLRPWAHSVNVRVNLRPGIEPEVVEV